MKHTNGAKKEECGNSPTGSMGIQAETSSLVRCRIVNIEEGIGATPDQQIGVLWIDDAKFYYGKVTAYDSRSERHFICYTDGEKEWLKLKKEVLDLSSVQTKQRGRGLPKTTSSTAKSSSRTLGVNFSKTLIGQRIGVLWKDDSKFYYGWIDAFDASANKHYVIYDDGDEEWLDLRKEVLDLSCAKWKKRRKSSVDDTTNTDHKKHKTDARVKKAHSPKHMAVIKSLKVLHSIAVCPRATDIAVRVEQLKKNEGLWKAYSNLRENETNLLDTQWRPFKEARSFVQKLRFRNCWEFARWSFSERRPEDIPMRPQEVYRKSGFTTFNDFLGVALDRNEPLPISANDKDGKGAPRDSTSTSTAKHAHLTAEIQQNCNGSISPPPKQVQNDQCDTISPIHNQVAITRSRSPESDSGVKARSWTEKEDSVLKQLVQIDGNNCHDWTDIAQAIGGKNGKQCRERWFNHLRPGLRFGPWSEEEELMLIEAHSRLGPKWKALSDIIAWRSEVNIKNHWNSTLRRTKTTTEGQREPSALENYVCDYSACLERGHAPPVRHSESRNDLVAKVSFQEAKVEMAPSLPAPKEVKRASKAVVRYGELSEDRHCYSGCASMKRDKERDFEKARKFARSLQLKTPAAWLKVSVGIIAFLLWQLTFVLQIQLHENSKLPKDMPRDPCSVFMDSGWLSWSDFLGHGRWRTFQQAREFAIGLLLSSEKEWKKYCSFIKMPADIPIHPPVVYKEEWTSWSDFLRGSSVLIAHSQAIRSL